MTFMNNRRENFAKVAINDFMAAVTSELKIMTRGLVSIYIYHCNTRQLWGPTQVYFIQFD